MSTSCVLLGLIFIKFKLGCEALKMISEQPLNSKTAFTSGGNNTPDLGTSLHCGEKYSSWVAGILDLNTQMIKTTTLVCCYVTHHWTACVMVSRDTLWSCRQETDLAFVQTGIKGRCCARSVSAEERKGGVVCSSLAN